jgi:hypothetical protein
MSGCLCPVEQQLLVVIDDIVEQQLLVVIDGMLNNNYKWSLMACWTAVTSGHWLPVEQQLQVVVHGMLNNRYEWLLVAC